MPKLKINNKEFELNKGDEIREACNEAGIPFGCEDGQCGVCMIEVKKGEELLNDVNEKETDLGLEASDKKHRLACQCRIKENSEVKDDDEIEVEGYL